MLAMKTARVILTFACPRKCSYCANNYKGIIDKGIEVPDLKGLKGFDEVILTGGEPSVFPSMVWRALAEAKDASPGCKVYMYTAQFKPWLALLMPHLDGIHYTVHENPTQDDIADFHTFQSLVMDYPDKSCRLYINQSVNLPMKIYPNAWKRIECKPWLSESECKLPPNETLYIVKKPKEQP